MGQVSVHEARNRLSQLIKDAQAGEDVVIASHGKPVVRLVPSPASGGDSESGFWPMHQRVVGPPRRLIAISPKSGPAVSDLSRLMLVDLRDRGRG